MARTEHLPIYKAAYDLCLWLEQVVRGFSRYHKYAIGSDLRAGSRRVLRLVVRANARTDKLPVLLELREEVEELKAMIRLWRIGIFRAFSGLRQGAGRFLSSRFSYGLTVFVPLSGGFEVRLSSRR